MMLVLLRRQPWVAFPFLVSCFLGLSCSSRAESGPWSSRPSGNLDHARQLTDAFGRLCPTQGVWTQNAVNAARSLEAMLDGIKDDPKCRSLASSLQSVKTLQVVLDRYSKNSEDLDLIADRRERHEILLQMQSTNDDATQKELGGALRNIEIQIGRKEERQESANSNLRDRVMTQSVVASMQTVLNQSLNQQECFLGKSKIYADLAALAGSVSAVAASGGISLAVGIGVELIGSGVEWARKTALAHKISKIDEASIHSAFSCALEALSNQWCSAQETGRLLELRTQSSHKSDDFSKGLQLLDRESVVFLQWLDQVRTGVRPRSVSQSERQVIYYAKESALKTFETMVPGHIADYEKKLPVGTTEVDLDARFRTVRNAVADLTRAVSPVLVQITTTEKNPVYSVVDEIEFPWKIVGVDEAPSYGEHGATVGVIDFFSVPIKDIKEKYPDVYSITLVKIEENIGKIIQEAYNRLSAERMRVLQPDPRLILWDVETSINSGPIRELSPLQALDTLLDYIDAGAGSETSPNRRFIYADTKKRLQTIRSLILTGIGNRIPPKLPFMNGNTEQDQAALEILRQIYEQAALEQGSTFLESRIRRIVRDRLTRWILDPGHSELDSSTSAQLLAAQDIIDEYRLLGRTSLISLRVDLDESIPIIKKTSQGFAEVFAVNLAKNLQFHRRNLAENPNDPISRRMLAKNCLLLMSVPDWSSSALRKIPIDACDGISQFSIFPGGNSSHKISLQEYKSAPYAERACHYRNFLRSERIREIFDGNPLK